jgi:hypothetical protein
MSTFTDNDRERLVDIVDRLARIEQASIDRKDHGPRITILEHWKTKHIAIAATLAAISSQAHSVAAPLVALLTFSGAH